MPPDADATQLFAPPPLIFAMPDDAATRLPAFAAAAALLLLPLR